MELRQQMETRKRESKLALQRKNSEAERKTKQVKERDFLDDFFSLYLSRLFKFFFFALGKQKNSKSVKDPRSHLSLCPPKSTKQS